MVKKKTSTNSGKSKHKMNSGNKFNQIMAIILSCLMVLGVMTYFIFFLIGLL